MNRHLKYLKKRVDYYYPDFVDRGAKPILDEFVELINDKYMNPDYKSERYKQMIIMLLEILKEI